MPDAEVQAALDHWGPRLIQNGVDYNDLMTTMGRIDTWAQWLPEWNKTADVQEADASGHSLTAGQAWRRASVNRHFGKFVWTWTWTWPRRGRGEPRRVLRAARGGLRAASQGPGGHQRAVLLR